MGRKKIGMELIKNERSRNLTYQKRKKGLEKKAEELSILCQVKLCVLIYGDKVQEEPATLWPEKETVQSLIESYRARSDDDRRLRTHDLSFYFREIAKKVEMESSKLRKKNYEAKYPTWDQFYDNLSTHELKQISASLEAKIELIKQRMEYLKGTQIRISLEDMQAMSYVGKQTIATPQPCIMQSLVRKNSLQLEIIEEEQQPLDVPPTMNFPAEMMMMMINTHHVNNNNNIVENQLGGMQGMMMIDQNNMLFDDHPQPMCYFVPVVTPTNYFHHHHQYPMLPTHAPSQRGQYYYEMDHQFHLPNNNMK